MASSPIKLNLTMKKLISSGQYKEALGFFDRQLPKCTDITFTLALKASTKLYDHHRGVSVFINNYHQNPFLQTSLIHSYNVNEVIVTILCNACGKLSNDHSIKVGKDVLSRLPNSFLHHQKLINSAVDMLMEFGHVKDAERMFEQMKKKSIVTYGAMMQGYFANNHLFEKALNLFKQSSACNCI